MDIISLQGSMFLCMEIKEVFKMALPLQEVQTKKHMAPKPGNIVDEYIRVQEINSAIDECEKQIASDFTNPYTKRRICDIIDKWLRRKK